VQRLRNALLSLNAWFQEQFFAGSQQEVVARGASKPFLPANRQDSDAAIDVRDIIAAGGEPLDEILRIASDTPAGGKFHVDAPFDPLPLRTMLGQMGFLDSAVQLAPQHWRVTFELQKADGETAAKGARMWHGQDGLHIDVGHLDPAHQTTEIFALADACANVPRLTIHLRRSPVDLATALEQRGWNVAKTSLPQEDHAIVLTRDSRA
jgi:hypothetical protein